MGEKFAANPVTGKDQAAAICFLGSSVGAYITGTDLLVDGGLGTMLTPASSFGDHGRNHDD